MNKISLLKKFDFFFFPLIICLMISSLLIISSMTMDINDVNEHFFTHFAKAQMKWFLIGWVVFFIFAYIDYKKFMHWYWFLYAFMIIMLLGLFFINPIKNVNRWYIFPYINMSLQPSEYAKVVIVITLAKFLDKDLYSSGKLNVILKAFVMVFIPCFLILKQPDLGTAIIIYAIALSMCYVANINKRVISFFVFCNVCFLFFVCLIFLHILPHEKMKPFFSCFLKEYQYERLGEEQYHQQMSANCIALGGIKGSGWHKSDVASKKWLPAAHTDSVFSAFAEEFGLIGIFCLMCFFYLLIFRAFYIAKLARDNFGKMLASGIAIYLSIHIIINIAMMCGFLPISGVSLILITYGGSFVISTMMLLGILQSIYIRRFVF